MSELCKYCHKKFNHSLCGTMSCDCQEICYEEHLGNLESKLTRAEQVIDEAEKFSYWVTQYSNDPRVVKEAHKSIAAIRAYKNGGKV